MNYTCPCCGYKTLDEVPPGTYDICSICFWEDDELQFNEPDYDGGANKPSLIEAQLNFLHFGASDKNLLDFVRKPSESDLKDPTWKPIRTLTDI